MKSWICCQLGAREHYAVPRALLITGMLGEFITDLWIRPGTLLQDGRNVSPEDFIRDSQVRASKLQTLPH